ncbi:MAG: 16S rRNA (cytidine(1402)-2'-O)-methyltransferase [Holosporaceae bacterium]|nr:16S rRNA (cytidine(1402)-2'-O)-methyltransferase [Holosporaceae bacterium]
MTDPLLSSVLGEKISQKLHDQQHKPGLYVVATPIGNILDISLRALYIFKKSKYIFAEDTRQTKKLLNFYEIKTPLITCHEYNEDHPSVISKIEPNDIYALVSDAGTPLISDPGYRIVDWCVKHQIEVFPVPGACAPIAGLSAAGLPTDNFTFHGFLPSKARARRSRLDIVKDMTSTAVFLESPERILDSLQDMLEIFGDRRACICREITKIFEEFRRGNLSELIEYFSKNKPIGEFLVIISGKREICIDKGAAFVELSAELKTETLKNAVMKVFSKYEISKKAIYDKALEIKRESS